MNELSEIITRLDSGHLVMLRLPLCTKPLKRFEATLKELQDFYGSQLVIQKSLRGGRLWFEFTIREEGPDH